MTMQVYHEVLTAHAHVKRFYERWSADPDFRQALAADPAGTLARYRLQTTPEEIRSLLEPEAPGETSPGVRAMWNLIARKEAWVQQFFQVETLPSDLRMRAWRERQIERQRLDLGPALTAVNLHAPLCFELSSGCSVGCWFCALSPESLQGVFPRTVENAALWRSALEVLKSRLGPAVKAGFLYWATDPLDNPDYEQFCLDFYDLTGTFPPTTTAQAWKNPARTRALIAMASERGCWLNRFSVLTLGLLGRIHAEFSADELALVECLPLNREASFAYGNAGRFRERAKKDPSLLAQQRETLRWAPWYARDPNYTESEDYPFGSIGCVTGFLINMVERSIRLISPCTADDRWPLGYIVYGEGAFSTATGLAEQVDRLIAEHMATEVSPDRRVRLLPFLHYRPLADGFELVGRFGQRAELRDAGTAPVMLALGDLVASGEHTAAAIAAQLYVDHRCAPELVQVQLNRLLALGVLDEEALAGC